MSDSEMSLELFRLQRLEIEFNDDSLSAGEDDERCREAYTAEADFDLWERAEGAKCVTKLRVDCYPESPEVVTRFSKVSITLFGIFSFSAETTEEMKSQLARYNSVAILHGIARGVVVSATGSCPGGPFLLPVLNYHEIIEKKLAQESAPHEEGCGDEEDTVPKG